MDLSGLAWAIGEVVSLAFLVGGAFLSILASRDLPDSNRAARPDVTVTPRKVASNPGVVGPPNPTAG